MKYFYILFISYICIHECTNTRSPLYYYPFTNKQPPTTPMEKLKHDLDILAERQNKNVTKNKK